MQTHNILTENKLIKLINAEELSTGKQTHKTHKLIREGCAIISTGKQTHKTHITHGKSTGNKLIKLIKRGAVDETHEFLKASPRRDEETTRDMRRLDSLYEFYEFPPTPTREEKQYNTRVKTCTRRDWKQTHRTHKLIRLQGVV
jgi:hypothetical protein